MYLIRSLIPWHSKDKADIFKRNVKPQSYAYDDSNLFIYMLIFVNFFFLTTPTIASAAVFFWQQKQRVERLLKAKYTHNKLINWWRILLQFRTCIQVLFVWDIFNVYGARNGSLRVTREQSINKWAEWYRFFSTDTFHILTK